MAAMLIISISAIAQRAYITTELNNTVSVINVATNSVIATIPLGTHPQGVSVSPDGTKVYITNNQDNTVSVINTSTNSVTATIPVGFGPYGIAVSPDGSLVYVGITTDHSVCVINTSVDTVSATIPIGAVPQGIIVSPDGTKVYVANYFGQHAVSVITTATNTVTATIAVGIAPMGICISPDGTKVYVANGGDSTVSAINTTTNSIIATITVGMNPYGVSISPNGNKVYVANINGNTVSVISTATNTVINTIIVGAGPFGISMSPDGSNVYVSNYGDNTVSVINTSVDTVSATIPVGNSPVAFGNFISSYPCISPSIPVLNASLNQICSNNPDTLSIVTGTLNNATNWQWYSDSCGGTSVGSGTSVIVFPTATTTYYSRGEGGCYSNGNCGSITITVNTIPSPTIIPNGNTTFCQGDSISLNAGIYTSYQWSSSATTELIFVTSSGNYIVTVSDNNGCTGTTSQAVIVNPSPVIFTQPLNQTINVGNNVQFLVIDSVNGCSTQWQLSSGTGYQNLFNVGPYIGVNTDTLNISNVQTFMNNYYYRCIISCGQCSDTSNVGILTVDNTTGINESTMFINEIILYPNPSNTFLNIHLFAYSFDGTLLIIDVWGRKVLYEKLISNDSKIDVSKWSNGVYFYQIKNDKETLRGKFVVEK